MLCVVRNRIRLSRIWRASRREPGNYVGDVLLRHRFAGRVSTPIRCAQFGTAGDDDCAQPLIADQREERIICYAAGLWPPVTARAMAGFAVSLVSDLALGDIARGFRPVGRWMGCLKNSASAPTRS